MMKKLLMASLLVICCTGTAARAELYLELSSADDLMNLMVGDTATIDVSLSGLLPGEQLVTLTGSVLYDATILDMSGSITAGAIIPNATDLLDMSLPGQADAWFYSWSFDPADYISNNGVFYSFDVQAQEIGSGVFSLDPISLIAEQYDPGSPFFPILRWDVYAGADLPFNVVVPAFPALHLALLGLAVAGRKLRARAPKR